MRIDPASVLVDDQDKAKRLTVVSPDDPDGVELVLEPDAHPAARPFKVALVEDGIPYTAFAVDDVAPVFDDMCGNLIQIHAPRDQ